MAEQAATAAGTPGKVVKQGHRNLLVHGPLQLILLLELLTRKAPGVCDVPGAMIEEIEYKNLSPLYAEEPLKICGRPTDTEGVYDLWTETPAGGYAVKATAKVLQIALYPEHARKENTHPALCLGICPLLSKLGIIAIMKLPPIAPFPPPTLRKEILPGEWEACIDAWITLVTIHLRLSAQDFISNSMGDSSSIVFLTSYVHEVSHRSDSEVCFDGLKARSLRQVCFLLAHRFLSGDIILPLLLDWTFLADLSSAYVKSISLRKLFESLWARHAMLLEPGFQKLRHSLVLDLEKVNGNKFEDLADTLCRIGPLLYVSQGVSRFFMVGSDFLDALFAGYMNASQSLQRRILITAYLGLVSLLGEIPNSSLLLDHLYGLKDLAEVEEKTREGTETLVSDLVTNTPLVRKLRDGVSGADAARAKSLIGSLEAFRNPKGKRHIRRKTNKGKGRAAVEEIGQVPFDGEVHVHRMSLVMQIQDLFPDLGSSFIIKLLDEYSDNAELITSHLLEGSLLPHLHGGDRTEELSTAADSGLALRSTPPLIPSTFDNDAFDSLAIDPSRLHIGRKNEKQTADSLLSDRSTAPNKAAILSALAAFDSDDDERDDTYDIEDIGRVVGSSSPAGDPSADLQDEKEETLFSAYKHDPGVFLRDSATRLSRARQALRGKTGMTDEVIEGWGIMLGRDPGRLRKLEAKYTAFTGAQRELLPATYRGSSADSGNEESDGVGGVGGRGGLRGRRRGGKGGRGRGSVAGPSSEKETQVSRQRKEASKSSRANHNRRDQRARKMARGGFAA
ncbi:hypothetical protein FGG08_003466 [Glutinoglossum americanum]|uniref:CUE domain-containing protein n=1 Tax=Glutinoglossum americanum TaxID=1670608 RepID=A0A9P8I2F6_9PEZI|nr:hypothetical protein FGG08_003466 [Glutinoglossum americanum]